MTALPHNPDYVFVNVRLRRSLGYRKSLRSENIRLPHAGHWQGARLPLDLAFVLHYSHDVTVRARAPASYRQAVSSSHTRLAPPQSEKNMLQITVARRKKRTRQAKALCSLMLALEDAVRARQPTPCPPAPALSRADAPARARGRRK